MRLIVLLCATALAAGCGIAPTQETETSMPAEEPTRGAETPIAAAAGETFTLSLDANPSTGYQWALAQPLDEATVRLVGSEYVPPVPSMPGAGGSEIWRFQAVKAGTARIRLQYIRPWEQDAAPAETRAYVVTVR